MEIVPGEPEDPGSPRSGGSTAGTGLDCGAPQGQAPAAQPFQVPPRLMDPCRHYPVGLSDVRLYCRRSGAALAVCQPGFVWVRGLRQPSKPRTILQRRCCCLD